MDKQPVNKRYDYLAPKQDLFGVNLRGIGVRVSPPGTPYQVPEEGSPYPWKRGRIMRDYALVQITSGGGTLRYGRSSPVPIVAGDTMLIHPGVWHDYSPSPATGWHEQWIVFNGPMVRRMIMRARLPTRPPVIHGQNDMELRRLFMRMLEVAETSPALAEMIHAGLVIQAVSWLQSLTQSQRERRENGGCSFVQQARRRLMETGSNNPDIARLARELGVSYTHFRRVFKASTGVSPRQFLINARIARAIRLLEDPLLKLGEVASRSGFSDPFYFSRLFKRKTGLSPSQWRE